jgi:hypothetical protein
MYRQVTAQRSLYAPPVYSPVVSICTASLQPSGHYMYRQFIAQWSLYVPSVYSPVVTICSARLQTSGHYMYRQFTAQWSLYVPPGTRPTHTVHIAYLYICTVCRQVYEPRTMTVDTTKPHTNVVQLRHESQQNKNNMIFKTLFPPHSKHTPSVSAIPSG